MNDDAQPGDDVLSGLPRTRPTHTSPKRAAARAKAARAAKPPAGPKTPRKPRAKASQPEEHEAAPKVAVPEAKAAERPPERGYATPDADRAPSGAELVATAVQAAGEIVDLGGRALRGILGRLPKP